MGVAGSTAKVCNLTQQELDGFVGTSHFSAAEVKALWVQFASLGKADGGSEILLNRADFQTAVGMKNSTFVDRLFAVFEEKDDATCRLTMKPTPRRSRPRYSARAASISVQPSHPRDSSRLSMWPMP